MSKLQKYTLGEFPVHTAAKPEKPEKLTIGRFLDIAQLSLGLGAYVAWLEAQDKKPDPLLKKGRVTARRYRAQYEEGFNKFFGSLMERNDVSRLKPAWRVAMRAGAPDVVFVRRGEFFKAVMPWLRMHQQVMRDLFTGKAYQIALKMAQAAGSEDPVSMLAKLAVIPPASGLRIPRKWNEEAAKAVGAEPSTTELVMVDAVEAQAQAEKLRDVQTALDAAEPGSEEEAGLGAEKAAIQSQIEEIAAESKDPSAVRATAIAASAEQPTSRIAQKAGLTPEQADALVAEGNIIITAGAGAGKTKTLAAKVAYFVEEKGYRPEQIMATSFTNASATELKERVAAEFGITEANIGTTHSIAKQIIKAFRPDWEGALNAAPSGEINKLFKIAMAQVELTPGARSKRWATESREAAWGGGRGKGRGGGGGYRNLYKDALGKWFNLGEKLLDQKGRPIGAKRLKNYIGKWKMGGWGPDQAWSFYQNRQNESLVAFFAAAVYGAYEYLKNEDAQFAPAFDFDDWLLKATEILEQDPRALESMQRRYKVVLVDEAQDLNHCVHEDTEVQTPGGKKLVRDLRTGDRVLSYDCGSVVFKTVTNIQKSSWDHGYRLHTKSGHTLALSPNHRIYATPDFEISDGQMALYLMYREGMGFRIGASTRPISRTASKSASRASAEHADCLWVLEVGDASEILYKEQALALTHGIPTYVYEGDIHGCDQERIDRIFQEFGENGRKLLEVYDLYFEYPHWTNTTRTTGRFHRKTLALNAHRVTATGKTRQRGNIVTASWSGEAEDLGEPLYQIKSGRWMLNRFSRTYNEASHVAHTLAARMDARVVEDILVDGESCVLTTASALLPGMSVPLNTGSTGIVLEASDLLPIQDYRTIASKLEVDIADLGQKKFAIHERLRAVQVTRCLPEMLPPLDDTKICLDEIVAVEPIGGGTYFDLSVADTGNFFGNGILSHNTQHRMFGLIAAQADTFAMIGDDKQCLEKSTMISTPSGVRPLAELVEGDAVLSYRNGKIVPQKLRHLVQSQWKWGFKVTTESGKTLTMSPTHKLWAAAGKNENKVLVYLMYRADLGYRIGITNKGWPKRGTDYLNGWAFAEQAEKMWVLDVCDSRDEALLEEQSLSLEYGIPTCVFNGEKRGLNQERINAVFARFGENGAKLLRDRHLKESLPHWISQGYTKHERGRRVVHLVAHTPQGTQVAFEWPDESLNGLLEGLPPSQRGNVFTQNASGGYRLRRYFSNYRDGLAFAEALADRVGGLVNYRLSTTEGKLRYLPASALISGMRLAAEDGEGGLELEAITAIERVEGEFLDVDVEDASNLFAEHLLVSNSIYGFRGAVLEEMTSLPEKGFEVKQLALNFRSGASIVEAGNSVISHNTGQIPMKCYANVERKGMGQIRAVETGTHEEAAAFAANEIKQNLDAGTPLADEKGTPQFGILVRNNAEADAYALALMAHGIPFRTKTDFFNKPIIKAALAWLTINTGKPDEAVNDAICNAHNTPGFYLDKQFGYWMGKRCGRDENYLQYLLGGGPVYDQAWRDRKMVAAYREVVEQVTSFEGNTAQVLRMIMDIRGSKQSFQDSLIEQINPDDLADDLGREPTEEEIKEAALVPIRPVMRVADNFEDPTKMMDFIGKLQRANAKHRKDEENTEPAVQIGTVHGWKGLEAYNVWISMAGGVFPPDPELMARDATPDPIIKPQTMEDERRLAYVAITRGMDSVSIMSPRENYRGMEAGMSQFIDEACVGIEGYTRPEEDEEATQDSPPPGRSASEQPASRQLSFGEILDGFLKGATLDDFYEDEYGPESELEADWEYLP